MPDIRLRDYQFDCNKAFWEAVGRGMRRGLCVLPTGTGKTVTFAKAIHTARRLQGKRPALILAHRDELIDQAVATIHHLMPYLQVDVEKGGATSRPTADVVVGSVQSLGTEVGGARRMRWVEERGGLSLVIFDEAHHGAAPGYRRVAERMGCMRGETPLWGTTATPKRFDSKKLVSADGKALFEEQFFTYRMIDAINDGWLCPVRGYIIVIDDDISGVRMKGEDFDQAALADHVDRQEWIEPMYNAWKEKCDGRCTVGFCASVEHARHSAEYFSSRGVPCAFVCGDKSLVPVDVRRRVLRDWKEGRLRVVFNVGILTEGFDLPAISCVIGMRPTKSWGLYAQCVGRGTRPFRGDAFYPAKDDCIVLDCTDNSAKHRLDDDLGAGDDDTATLSTLIDLPAGIDLEGRTLGEARAAWDAAEEEGKDTSGVRSLSSLKTAAKAVDLFQEAQLPPEVKRLSFLSWAKIGSGYILCAPPRVQGEESRTARLTQDALGHWTLQVRGGGITSDQRIGKDRIGNPEFAAADSVVCKMWQDARGLLSHRSRWRTEPITEKQAAFLRRLKYPEDQIVRLTKGEAGTLMARFRGGGMKAVHQHKFNRLTSG